MIKKGGNLSITTTNKNEQIISSDLQLNIVKEISYNIIQSIV